MRKSAKKPAEETREETAKRLQFTEADLHTFASVPPPPLPVERLAELGADWAVTVMRTRKHHTRKDQRHHHNGCRLEGGGYYCYGCQLAYPAAPTWLEEPSS